MGCSTFFFRCSEEIERAVGCLQRHNIEFQCFRPSAEEPAIRLWAVSVKGEASSKAREILLSGGIALLGQYDLPVAERPLPLDQHGCSNGKTAPAVINNMWIDFIDQCFADTDKIRLIAHHDADVAPLLPYLNSTLKAAQYSPEIPALSFKKGVRLITIYRDKVGIAKADDLLDAWLCLREVKEKIQWVHEHKEQITPNFDMYTPPSALDVYKLLPRTNCSECGKPTCMAFAVAVANGEAEADMCPVLMKGEWAEGRNELLELLEEAP